MSRIIIDKKVSIKPMYLDSSIQEHLYSKICEELVGKCDSTNGYVLKIYKNIKILENMVSSASSNVFFHIQFTAKVMKPEIGGKYTGKVCMVFSHGIFVEVAEKMKVLVPVNKLQDYKFVAGVNIFKKEEEKGVSVKQGSQSVKQGTSVKQGASVKQGDEIEVIVDMVKYEKHNFNCIGRLA